MQVCRIVDVNGEAVQIDRAPWQSCGAAHVGVYGTLRAGGVNDIRRLRPGIACVGRSMLTGTLHDLGWYPGLRLQGDQPVLAEVYALDALLEQPLDGIEGLWPQDVGEYAKRLLTVAVTWAEGETQLLRVLVYEALPAAMRGALVIAVSDWMNYNSKKVRSPS
jgi:gamma-glutamylcyclotransferase (GGCT)/AIG2-like uncharacterized protein YtfP